MMNLTLVKAKSPKSIISYSDTHILTLSPNRQGREMIESNIDSKEWELEVERVAPRLKIPLQNDAKEWRNHIEQAKTYGQTIKKSLPDARGKLERMSENLGKVLEKITGREKRINVNMNELV